MHCSMRVDQINLDIAVQKNKTLNKYKQFKCSGLRKLYRFFVSFFREWGRSFDMWAHKWSVHRSRRTITIHPHHEEADSSCVVAIKMKSLYFVTLTFFIFVFNISMSTSVNFCIRPIVYTNTQAHTTHLHKRDSSLSL